MLDDLVQTIETLRVRIRDHRDYLESYESRTRVALIDPMLYALGWDVANPATVEIEPLIGRGWADYALLDDNRNPVMLIEAKKLSDRDADGALDQATMYLLRHNRQNNPKVFLVAYTNGDRWQVVDVTKQDQEPVVMDVSLATTISAAKCALGLLGLWQPNLSAGGFAPAADPLINAQSVSGSAPTAQTQVEPPPDSAPMRTSAQPPATAGGGWTPLTEDFAARGNPPPKAIRFPGSTERPMRYWFEILRQTALYLVESNLLTPQNCLIKGGSTRYLFSLDGKHSNGAPFAMPSLLGDTGIILETNVSARGSVRQAKRLLEHFNQDPSQVFLKLS